MAVILLTWLCRLESCARRKGLIRCSWASVVGSVVLFLAIRRFALMCAFCKSSLSGSTLRANSQFCRVYSCAGYALVSGGSFCMV